MKTLAPCLLMIAAVCLSSCSSTALNMNPGVDPSITAYLKTLNKEAQDEHAPYRYRISADGTAFEKYPAPDFDAILDEIDTAPPQPTAANAVLQLDILTGIGFCEQERGGDKNPVIVETRPLLHTNGYYREAWIVDRKGDIIEYLVTVKPAGADGVNCKVYPL